MLAGCAEETAEPRDVIVSGVEQAFPYSEPDEIRRGWFQIDGSDREQEYIVVDGLAIVDGDILVGAVDDLTAEQLGIREPDRSAVRPDKKWKNATVPYEIHEAMPKARREMLMSAIEHWHNHTRVRLVPRKKQDDYVLFIPSDTVVVAPADKPSFGCWSTGVGRLGGMQLVGLEGGCDRGAAIHEIGHVVGLYHEQSRTDRHEHIVIHGDNIEKGMRSQFWTYKQMNQFWGGFKGANIGAYDFDSIMHYPSSAFSKDDEWDPVKNEKPTITRKKNGGRILGQRDGLSAGDKKGVAFLYGSPGKNDAPDSGDGGGGGGNAPPEPTDVGGPDRAAIECWLTDLYAHVLGREPDGAGLADWADAIENGLAPGEAAGGFVRSNESITRFLHGLYSNVLRRAADEGGLADWIAAMENGMSQTDASAGFLGSNEYFVNVAGGDRRRLVEMFYADVLGRTPSTGELDDWLAVLGPLDDAEERRTLAYDFLRSDEARGRAVDAAYRLYLEREPDPDGRAAYLAAMQNGLVEEVLAIELMTSPEYQGRCGW
jgi:hypothetical protein